MKVGRWMRERVVIVIPVQRVSGCHMSLAIPVKCPSLQRSSEWSDSNGSRPRNDSCSSRVL